MLCVLMGQALFGQEEKTVTVDFMGLSLPDAVDGIYYVVGDIKCPVEFSPGFLSREYHYHGLPKLVFYRDEPDSEGVMQPVEVASIKLPRGASKLSLLFVPDGNAEGHYRIRAFADDANKFQGGGYRFVNMTNRHIAVALGEERRELNRGQSVVIGMTEQSRSATVQVKLAAAAKEEWKLIFSTNWAVNPRVRTLVIIYRDEKGDYEVKRIRETLKGA